MQYYINIIESKAQPFSLFCIRDLPDKCQEDVEIGKAIIVDFH